MSIEASYAPAVPSFSRIMAQTLFLGYLEEAADLQAAQRDQTQAIVLRARGDERFAAILELSGR